MILSLGSDHAGFEQKQALVAYLADKGYEVIDRGPDTDERVDYPDYAVRVAYDVAQGRADRGVLVCGTGIGMALAADQVAGIRAANITLSGRFVDLATNKEIVDIFLTTEFAGGRHADRVAKIMKLDAC